MPARQFHELRKAFPPTAALFYPCKSVKIRGQRFSPVGLSSNKFSRASNPFLTKAIFPEPARAESP